MEAISRTATLEALRAAIRERETAPLSSGWGVCPTGFAPFDAALPGGGLPRGRVVELTGAQASGKLTLALGALAQATREKGLAAFVDPSRTLYPPAAFTLGVERHRLLIVRPADPRQALRATALIARSRAFVIVVLDLADLALPRGRLGTESSRLLDAAQGGRTAILLLSRTPSGLDTTLRLSLERTSSAASDEVVFTIERNRLGPPGKHGRCPLWSAA